MITVTAIKDDGADIKHERIYQMLPDVAAESSGLLRVIDESGEDYLYSAINFRRNKMSDPVELIYGLPLKSFVKWKTLDGKVHEGILVDWDNGTAIVQLANGED
jgi:hypothetical protein